MKQLAVIVPMFFMSCLPQYSKSVIDNSHEVVIEWTTGNEGYVEGYSVEVSSNRRHWRAIGKVDPHFSPDSNKYRFVLPNKENYYRVKATMTYGTYYSKVVYMKAK